MTYFVNGRQYVAIASGGNILSFALPEVESGRVTPVTSGPRRASAMPLDPSDAGMRNRAGGREGDFGGDIFHNLDVYWQQSRLQYAKDVKTPPLALHSDNDYRVPLEEGEQWRRSLQLRRDQRLRDLSARVERFLMETKRPNGRRSE